MHTHNEQANKVPTENDNSDTKQGNMQQSRSDNNGLGKDSSEQ